MCCVRCIIINDDVIIIVTLCVCCDCSWPSWNLTEPRAWHGVTAELSTSEDSGPIAHFTFSGSTDVIHMNAEELARFVKCTSLLRVHCCCTFCRCCCRFEVGGEIEFDVYTKRFIEDDESFIVDLSTTPAAQFSADVTVRSHNTDAALNDRYRLLRQMISGGGTAHGRFAGLSGGTPSAPYPSTATGEHRHTNSRALKGITESDGDGEEFMEDEPIATPNPAKGNVVFSTDIFVSTDVFVEVAEDSDEAQRYFGKGSTGDAVSSSTAEVTASGSTETANDSTKIAPQSAVSTETNIKPTMPQSATTTATMLTESQRNGARPGFVYVPADIKRERTPPYGPVYLVPAKAKRRVIIRVIQCDNKPCLLESCVAVRVGRSESTAPLTKTKTIGAAFARIGRTAKKPQATTVNANVSGDCIALCFCCS